MSTFMHDDTILSNLSFFLDSKLTTPVDIACLCFVKQTPNNRSTLIIPLLLNSQSVEAHEECLSSIFYNFHKFQAHHLLVKSHEKAIFFITMYIEIVYSLFLAYFYKQLIFEYGSSID